VSGRNPFGDDAPAGPRRANLFGGDEDAGLDAASRIEHAARKIRGLRTQMGAEGLTLSATRELIDELTAALDAAARALREMRGR
jgi:flagellin-like hook-associated protein FlgL